jgi:hypothetical protein
MITCTQNIVFHKFPEESAISVIHRQSNNKTAVAHNQQSTEKRDEARVRKD